MCAVRERALTCALAVISLRGGAPAGELMIGAAAWFAGVYVLVFVLAVIALRTVGVSGDDAGMRQIDATGVLVFAVTFAVAFVVVTAGDVAWGQLLAFGSAIAASAGWRALRE